MKRCFAGATLLIAIAAWGGDGAGRAVGGRSAPNPIPTTCRFEQDVLVEMSQDENRDNRPDLWWFYERGRLVRFESDSDNDGKADWRKTWKPDESSDWAGLMTQFIDGRWRIIPANASWPQEEQTVYIVKAEKGVDGPWTGRFVDEREVSQE